MRSPCGVLNISDSPSGLHVDYWESVGNGVWSPHGVHVDSLWTPWKPVGECKVLENSRSSMLVQAIM
jgi:hypothetical protein